MGGLISATQLVIFLGLFGAAVVGVLAYIISQKRKYALGQANTPELVPAKPAAAAALSATEPVIVELQPNTPLAVQLRDHCQRAEFRKLRPLFEVGASWCPPSRLFGNALAEPQMTAALAGMYLIRADMDAFDGDPKLRDLGVISVPVFFELDASGEATGRSMNGGAWGADTLDNMSSAIARFCA